jgi:hypothetical protein
MRFRFVSVFAALVLAVAACGGSSRTTYARHPGAALMFDRTSQDAKAIEIADKVIAAHGGGEKWAGAKQLRWSQTVTQDGKEIIGGEEAWDRWNGRHWGKARREGGDIVVMRSLYADDGKVFMEKEDRLRKIEGGAAEAITAAKQRWDLDTALMFMPWLLEEPGTKLEVAGEAKSEDGKEQDVLKVTFDPKDTTRTSTYFVVVDRATSTIARIEIQKAGRPENERLGYALTDYQDAGGMKYPTQAKNLGINEVMTFKDLKISNPDEDLWTPPPML